MASSDRRALALHAFDGLAREFAEDCAARCVNGGSLAVRDVDRLAALASRIAADLRVWSRAVAALEVSSEAPLAAAPAGRLILEVVFDEVLRPEALRVLAAAMDLAWQRL